MSSAETQLPPRPDSQTGEPRPPNAPIVIGMSKEPTQSLSGFGQPPEGFGPILEARGNSRAALFGAAGILCVVLAVFFTLQDSGLSWISDPVPWIFLAILAAFTILRDWNRTKLAVGADWFRVNRKWVDLYSLVSVRLTGALRGWTLALRDRDGRAVRVYVNEVETNREMWALVYNGMLHSAFHGATVNNTAAGMLRLRPGFEATRHQASRPKIPDRAAWTILLAITAVFVVMYFFRPDLLGPALAIFAGIVIVLALAFGIALTVMRRRERREEQR